MVYEVYIFSNVVASGVLTGHKHNNFVDKFLKPFSFGKSKWN